MCWCDPSIRTPRCNKPDCVPPPGYENAPVSINELRAQRSEDAADWTPRDVLVSLLRDIDSGKLKMSQVLVLFRTEPNGFGYRVATPSLIDTLGLAARIIHEQDL